MSGIIKQGQIWEVVTNSFITSRRHHKNKRRCFIEKGERIEIRYPYEWHFRTEDNEYYHCEPEVIINNAKLIGEIYDNVKFDNIAKLDEVLRLKLYKKVKNGR